MEGEPKQRRSATRLIHPDRPASTDFESLAVPTFRGSTVVFDSVADFDNRSDPEQYRYGLAGTPTSRELAQRIAALEGAGEAFLVPSGLAAIALTYFAYCTAGGHALLPASAYGPNLEIAEGMLAGLGIEVENYDPLIGGDIASLLRDNTQLIWCESPGSITMEMQDVPAICRAAKARGVPVAIDNTYGAGMLFDAFGAGVDVSVQALTKYQAGHSDVLMGSVSAREEKHARKVRKALRLTGMGVSPDDCSLVLRGLKTLDVRMKRFEESTLAVARWLEQREEVTALLHPAFQQCPGHEFWKRGYSGSASIFSVILGNWTRAQIVRFVDSLELFKIGYSWGGVNSLVICYSDLKRPTPETGPLLVRLSIGLEDPRDLIDDLEQALAKAAGA